MILYILVYRYVLLACVVRTIILLNLSDTSDFKLPVLSRTKPVFVNKHPEPVPVCVCLWGSLLSNPKQPSCKKRVRP